jgi:hypothetical protein
VLRSDGSRSGPDQSRDNAQGRSGGISKGSWANFKGNKLADPERGSTGKNSSIDDIPLVPSSKQQQH